MKNWATTVVTKYVKFGTSLVLMGALWLYLWVFPWYPYYSRGPWRPSVHPCIPRAAVEWSALAGSAFP